MYFGKINFGNVLAVVTASQNRLANCTASCVSVSLISGSVYTRGIK